MQQDQPSLRPPLGTPAHRKPPEDETDVPPEGRVQWSRPVIGRFGLERTLHFSGSISDGDDGTA